MRDLGTPSPNDIIQLVGGNANVNTITFSTSVTDPVIAIWSLGQSGIAARFDFNLTPTLQAGGPSNEYSGSSIVVSGDSVIGEEGNGTVAFFGTFSSITFANPVFENWYGFTVGVPAPVPEPSAYMLVLAGLAAFGFAARRKGR